MTTGSGSRANTQGDNAGKVWNAILYLSCVLESNPVFKERSHFGYTNLIFPRKKTGPLRGRCIGFADL